MKIFKKIIHLLSTLSYILILLYIIICIPFVFGYYPHTIKNDDMSPTYPKYSIIYYYKDNSGDIIVNDILTYKNKNKEIVSYRVASVNNGMYSFKKDNNDIVDENVKYKDILGKNINIVIHYLGFYTLIVAKYKYIFILSIILIISLEIILNRKRKKRIVLDE